MTFQNHFPALGPDARRGKAAPVACNVLCLGLLAAQTAAANEQAAPSVDETELPQKFFINCKWDETIRNTSLGTTTGEHQTTHSSSNHPVVLNDDKLGKLVELSGVGSTRHFVLPDLGSILAGEMTTVFADGRAVRSQTYDVAGELTVSSSIGHCEVIE